MSEVHHNRELSRFYLSSNGETAVLEYRETPKTIVFVHTGVPETLEGQGVRTTLVKAGLDYAREQHLRVRPNLSVCCKLH
jgi:predicted GNAT family acetyltransferase